MITIVICFLFLFLGFLKKKRKKMYLIQQWLVCKQLKKKRENKYKYSNRCDKKKKIFIENQINIFRYLISHFCIYIYLNRDKQRKLHAKQAVLHVCSNLFLHKLPEVSSQLFFCQGPDAYYRFLQPDNICKHLQ